MTQASEGSIDGVPYEIYDLTQLDKPGFVAGYYYTAGDTDGEPEQDDTVAVTLEGPFATKDAAIAAAQKFILDALGEMAIDAKVNPDRLVTDTPLPRPWGTAELEAEFARSRAQADMPAYFPVVPIDYRSKCKRLRHHNSNPTPCLCCPGDCVGA
jgi:hypothetical protein